MPRGKKKSRLEVIQDQITKIDTDIQKQHDKLNELQDRKKELLEQKKQQELDTLLQKIKESGKTVDEVLKAINE